MSAKGVCRQDGYTVSYSTLGCSRCMSAATRSGCHGYPATWSSNTSGIFNIIRLLDRCRVFHEPLLCCYGLYTPPPALQIQYNTKILLIQITHFLNINITIYQSLFY